ncbi:MAG: type 4a pilus biogenesis protein PilO [bacterium]|nr:type 4a pilus biogenesis protein PilO [bacterium]
MQKLLILLLIAVVFGGGFWLYYNMVYAGIPDKITALDREIRSKNERLISAEILAQELDLVSTLIERNLALSAQDSLAEDASMPFLDAVTQLLQDLDIKLISVEPKPRRTQLDHIKTPYDLTVECTYAKFGELVNKLEQSERLVTVESFSVDNGFRKAASTRTETRAIDEHAFEMEISTLTLIKR